MATEEKDYTEAPTSRLGANTVSASRALDAQRRANSAQRQGMALERTMQRKYRRAVRNNDLQAISTYGGQLDKMQISKFGGGGIQSAEENDLQAARRAERAREIGNQVGEETDRLTGKNKTIGDNGTNRTDSVAGAPDGDTGTKTMKKKEANPQAESDALASDAAKERQKIFGVSFKDRANQFFSDLENSKSIKRGDPKAIGAAAEAGKKFGITRDQIEAFSQGLPPSKKAIRERSIEKENLQKSQAAIAAEKDEIDANEKTKQLSEKLKGVKDAFLKDDELGDEHLLRFRNLEERLKAAEDQKSILNQVKQSRDETDRLLARRIRLKEEIEGDLKEANRQIDLWTAPEDEVLNKKKYIGITNVPYEPDPRSKAYELRKNVINDFDGSKINVYNKQEGRTWEIDENATRIARRDALQSRMIEKAISNNVDISGFANLDPDFKIKYEKALGEKKEIEEEKKAADLFASVGS